MGMNTDSLNVLILHKKLYREGLIDAKAIFNNVIDMRINSYEMEINALESQKTSDAPVDTGE